MLSIFSRQAKKPLVKETFVYTMTDVVGKAMAFILLPVVSFYLPPDELGIATNFTVLANLLVLLGGLVVVNGLPYFFYEQNQGENKLMISNLMILCALLCSFLLLITLFIHGIVQTYLQIDLHIQILCILYVLGWLVSQIDLNIFRLENNVKSYAILQVLQIFIHAIAVIIFVIVMHGGGVGKIYAEVIVFFAIGLLHFFILHRKGYLNFTYNSQWINKLLRFGIPLLPHSVSFWLKSGMDKVVITAYCGLQYNGLYSMAISISSLYTMLVQSFANAYIPYIQKILSSFDESGNILEKKKLVKQAYLLYLLFGIAGVVAVAGAWVIFHYLIDAKYLPAMDYIPLIILANFIYTFYHFVVQYIYKLKKTMVLGIITFTCSLLQILLSFWLVKEYGVVGALYGLLLGNTIVTIAVFIYSYKIYPMPWFGFVKRVAQNDSRAN